MKKEGKVVEMLSKNAPGEVQKLKLFLPRGSNTPFPGPQILGEGRGSLMEKKNETEY